MHQATKVKDRYGLPLSTGYPQAAEHYGEGLDLVLSMDFGAEERFREAVDADEGFALAHGNLALMLMLRLAVGEAKESVQRARSLAKSISRREQQQIEVIALFINGEGPRALALIREHLGQFPRDALLLRLANRLYLFGCSSAGVANFPQEFFGLLKSVESAYGDDWAFLSQYAFAHHETGLLEDARRMAERSLKLRPTNAVASHSVAHVFFETGDHSGGADFLNSWLEGFDRRATFRVHLAWHQALFQLAMGRYEQVLSVYESEIRPSVAAKNAMSLADSASLLWRMQMYGRCAPLVPWDEVRDLATPASETPGPAFRDAHAALAFVAAGDEAHLDRMIDRLRNLVDKGDPLACEVTLPLVQGIVAFAHGAYQDAVTVMEPVFGQLTRIGGSHAQREVFEDTLLEAYLRAEQFDKAEEMLRTRLGQRASTRDIFWLGRSQVSSGQPEMASTNLRDAAQRWRDADPGSPEITALSSLTDKLG